MIYELFSRRAARAKQSGEADVYQYSSIPLGLRVQIQQILIDGLGPQFDDEAYTISRYCHNPDAWVYIQKILCRERGVHQLTSRRLHTLAMNDVIQFVEDSDINGFIDCVELSCRYLERVIGQFSPHNRTELGIKVSPKDAVEEVNYRIREAGLGYQYEDGQFFRLDSEYVHQEIIKPALSLLRGKSYEGAQQEFLDAHAQYRAGDYEQAIVSAAKAFESALKAVCLIKGWSYDRGARASDLLKVVRAKGLWPDYLDGSFDQLIATLNSGLPRIRNDAGAHGQGPKPRDVPSYVAAYALQLCAAKISLISEASVYS